LRPCRIQRRTAIPCNQTDLLLLARAHHLPVNGKNGSLQFLHGDAKGRPHPLRPRTAFCYHVESSGKWVHHSRCHTSWGASPGASFSIQQTAASSERAVVGLLIHRTATRVLRYAIIRLVEVGN